MSLTIIMGLAAIIVVVFVATRLRVDFIEWSVYMFLLGLSIMPSRIRIMEPFPNSTLTALDLYIWLFLALFLAIRAIQPRPPRVDEFAIGVPLLLFCLWAYFSGFMSGYVGYFGAVSWALVRWVPAFLACWVGMSILPRSTSGMKRFETYYKAICSLIIAPQIILTAFNIGGWETDASAEATGFLRGWSCLGSGITTAACILPAYFLALRDFFCLRENRHWAIGVGCVIFMAVLFTLARSVMAVLILGTISITVHYSHRSLAQLATFIAIALIFGAGMWLALSQLSFSRLATVEGKSTNLRIDSLKGAAKAGFEQPIWGQGFGCLYDQAREKASFRTERETIDVAGYESALEPHNVYALCWSETGVVGLSLYIMLLLGFRRHSPFSVSRVDRDDHAERTIWWVLCIFFMSASGMLLYRIPAVFLSLPFMLVFFRTAADATRVR